MSSFDPRTLSRRDLRRLAGELWADPRCDGIAPAVVEAAVAAGASSLDRTVVTAYLRHFPRGHRAFDFLRGAAEHVAERRDWPWRQRGRDWRLWDPDAGPDGVARALLAGSDSAQVLRDAGLEADLAQGAFTAAALDMACLRAGEAQDTSARQLGEKLIDLVKSAPVSPQAGLLVHGLLHPWLRQSPPDDHKDRLSAFLLARYGHPKLQSGQWQAIEAEMPGEGAARLVGLLTGWLIQRAVRQFFAVVGATTNDPRQWATREAFWLAYLDDGAIDDAWFAFGRQAELTARGTVEEGAYGRITGSGADPSHSALILAIGDVRIAEWSHNGSCRFWKGTDPQAPHPYRRQYFGLALRAMNGGRGYEDGFAAIPHQSGWERKFASFVHSHSGRRHPVFGEGIWTKGWY